MKEESGGLPLKMGLTTLSKARRLEIAKMEAKAMKETYNISYYQEIGRRGARKF
jgi:hypothetical protein